MSISLKPRSIRPASSLFAALATSCALALLGAAPAQAASDARVRVGDLDLSSPSGKDVLRQRAKRAARQVCGAGSRSLLTDGARCRAAVLDEVAEAARVIEHHRATAANETHLLSALCQHR
ncbi:UrcA family protein [Caulobacter segnis]|uniref:UrcA family protein n=1 Tax=Caulobacter segnis TaxID=88688 RepID=UPI00240F4317|nr:UrcA family protein [Caulobacter segnis]MDG2520594.1 UrcA family protein [Caulobacter segnis]